MAEKFDNENVTKLPEEDTKITEHALQSKRITIGEYSLPVSQIGLSVRSPLTLVVDEAKYA